MKGDKIECNTPGLHTKMNLTRHEKKERSLIITRTVDELGDGCSRKRYRN